MAGRRWLKVLAPGALEEGDVTGVFCEGHALCLVRANGRPGAVRDACPHRGSPLSAGHLEDGRLVCPFHGWQFDPFDGTFPGGFESGLRAYPVEEREDGLWVAIEEA